MRSILLNLTWLEPNSRIKGGVVQYSERLTAALARYTDNQIYALLPQDSALNLDYLESHNNCFTHKVSSYGDILSCIDRFEIDVIHTPLQFHNIICLKAPMVHTLHDLQHIHFPHFFTDKEIAFREKYYKSACIFSDRIIVGYHHVKDDLVHHYSIDPDKIDICPVGFDPPPKPDQSTFTSLKDSFHLDRPYIFYAASTWEHKNHIGLINALQIVHEKYGHKISLVFTGHRLEPVIGNLQRAIRNSKLQEYVIFTGYLQEKEMLSLLNNASLVVIPTFYEAGSYPLLEAMSFHVPVICSNVTSLPDTIKNDRFTFHPNDTGEIADKINSLLIDEKLRSENIKNARNIIESMRWDQRIEYFLESYEKAIACHKMYIRDHAFRDKVLHYESLLHDYYGNQQKQVHTLEQNLANLYNSYSWRVTKPLRVLSRLPKQLISRFSRFFDLHDPRT